MNRPEVFQYFDFRRYLKDLTGWLKAQGGFNLRGFAMRAGIKAPGYLKMVTDGRRRLTKKTAGEFCRAFGISGRQRLYFQKLVLYNQTLDPDLKRRYFNDLIALIPRSSQYVLGKRQGRYLSQPHYVAIREMVALKDFREDHKWIARRCLPPIKPSQAKEAIETLLKLGFIKRDDGGRLIEVQGFVRTRDGDTDIPHAYHFHEAMLGKARHALTTLKQDERNFYSLTLPLPRKMFEEIISDFYRFRDQIIEKTAMDNEGPDEVYQIGFQLFPVTKKEGD